MKIRVKAPAKINLTLDVIGKRPDGYHELSTIMQTVDLYDTVTLYGNDSGKVTVSCNVEGIPCDDSNICAKAAYRFFDYSKRKTDGLHIEIEKLIPSQAGLAGGSSDGAAVILGLNRLLDARLKPAELNEIAARVGADVPFCLTGGTKLCEGIGEVIKKVPSFNCEAIVICKPDTVSVSTAEAYKLVDALKPHPPYTPEMIKALYSRDMFMISSTLYNDFEPALNIPEVNSIKKIMLNHKARGAGMSGSGSAVFGIFSSKSKAEKCLASLKEIYSETFICKPIKIGCEIID